MWIDNEQSARLASGAFPPDVVAELSKLEAHAARRNEAHPAGACPECGEPMQTFFVEVGQVAVDVCKRHGTWLDAGELARVARGEVTPPAAPPAARFAASPAEAARLQEQLLAQLASEAADGDGSQFHPLSRKIAEAFAEDEDEMQPRGYYSKRHTIISLVFEGILWLLSPNKRDDD